MGKSQREKGKRGERELAGRLRDHGYDCRRGQQFCGASGDADVTGLPGIHIECKRVERLNLQEAMEQSKRDARTGEMPTVFHRRDRSEWLVTMRLEDWIQLYKEWEAGQQMRYISIYSARSTKKATTWNGTMILSSSWQQT